MTIEQCTVLIKAINEYLNWHANKGALDTRGYKTGYFTRFRHFTAFGKNRAITLKAILSANPSPHPTLVLQSHFKNNSTINNHSLDTYLLECIISNKSLFLEFFLGSNDFNDNVLNASGRVALRKLIIDLKITPENAYNLANIYKENETSENLMMTCKYLSLAIQGNHAESLDALIILANLNNSEAQYTLGYHFCNHKGNFKEGLKWLIDAAELQHNEAIKHIKEITQASSEYACFVATYYEEQDRFVDHLLKAFKYYIIAAQNDVDTEYRLGAAEKLEIILNLNDITPQALIYIGNLYFKGGEGIKKDESKAKDCFEKACENDDVAYYYLGTLYHYSQNLKNLVTAAQYYKLASENGCEAAKMRVNSLLNEQAITSTELLVIGQMYHDNLDEENSDISLSLKFYYKASALGNPAANFLIAQYYQASIDSNPKGIELAFNHYLKAVEQGHPDALSSLERLGEEVSAEKQLLISQLYESLFKNHERASYWLSKSKEVDFFEFKI
ncbi:MAG: tetratricopeptide repeat protein [Legionella sp.]|nr:tetratricopeptide repeat protein [Legionella sp.]